MHPMVELQDVSKIYQDGDLKVAALSHVSLTVERGEFVAVVGPSGSGKSTLMNLIGCLDVPTEGVCRVAGRELSGVSADELARLRNREIGFVFQGFNLLAALTAVENVELPLRYRGEPAARRRELAVRALEEVGMGDRLGHRPSQLSGGQQQRVAIARAIAGSPPLILADEPTGSLDSAAGARVMELLRALWRQGKTVVIITHDQQIAAGAQRTVRIADGQVVSL